MLVPGMAVLFSSPRIGCKFTFFTWGSVGGKGAMLSLLGFVSSPVRCCLLEQDLLLGSTMPLELTLERLLC